MKPKVSVIIPVYNAEKYIKDCLNSVLSQTLQEIEVIIVNDGSSDNSKQIIENYEGKDNRIIVINKDNEGAGPSRNRGIQESKGEYIAFMDSDDYYPSNDVLEQMYNVAKNESVNIVGGKRVRFMEDGTLSYDPDVIELFDEQIRAKGRTKYIDYQYDYGYTQFIYNREMLLKNNIFFPKYRRYQDPPFFVKAMIVSNEFYFLDSYTYCFRRVFQPLATKRKWSSANAIDMIKGQIVNLKLSREHNLSKLHYITANRINSEGSFLAINNLKNEYNAELVYWLIKANSMIDVKWLKENGYNIEEPFVLDVFKYAVETAEKYESIRKHKIVRVLAKLNK